MEWIYDDGGRSKYFKAKNVGDCITRSIAIASQTDYKEVYDYIRKISGKTPRDGVLYKYARKAAEHFGGTWVPTMKIGTGCKVHLTESELPEGRLVVSVSKHYTAVIDSTIHDIFDPTRGGMRCVYGYYVFGSKSKED